MAPALIFKVSLREWWIILSTPIVLFTFLNMILTQNTHTHTSTSFPLCLPLQVGNVPGSESAFLAMDTEEGVEVVWNEVLFSDRKVLMALEVLQVILSLSLSLPASIYGTHCFSVQ